MIAKNPTSYIFSGNTEQIKNKLPNLPKLLASDIKKFQDLHLKLFRKTISYDDAQHELALLVRQMQVVYTPINTRQLSHLYGEKASGGLNG